MNQQRKPLLELSALSIAIEGRKILDSLNLVVNTGEILGLVGESGAGKTMTALAILGLLPRRSIVKHGTINFQGRNLLKLPQRELRRLRGRRIGAVFQDSQGSFDPVMRIDQQICEGMRYHLHYTKKQALKEMTGLLEKVGIDDPLRCMIAYPYQLSGGMRQRVLIASALSCKPTLLICDEITSSVDSITQSRLMSLLARLRSDLNVSILLITHDLRAARRTADRIAVLLDGTVVEEGEAEKIFQTAAHPFTQTLIASLPGAQEK